MTFYSHIQRGNLHFQIHEGLQARADFALFVDTVKSPLNLRARRSVWPPGALGHSNGLSLAVRLGSCGTGHVKGPIPGTVWEVCRRDINRGDSWPRPPSVVGL